MSNYECDNCGHKTKWNFNCCPECGDWMDQVRKFYA